MQRQPLSDSDRLDWLRLTRTERVGPVTFRQIMSRYDSAAEALAALPEMARRGGRGGAFKICPRAKAEDELAALAAAGARLVALCEPEYPEALAATEGAPPMIAVRGAAHLLSRPVVAVVGARNASAAGVQMARRLARDLGANDFTVVSGLARGIDGAAHEGALETGTIAVLAGGIDVVYPPEHEELQARIGAMGLLVAEMPPGTKPLGRHFPRRNRIISGLSLGVVVVEAALRSGSLITARLAGEQGREVFAVPGSPLDPRAKGTNGLIRQGAVLTEGAEDVIEALSPMLSRPLSVPEDAEFKAPPDAGSADITDTARDAVRNLLGPVAVDVDELLRQCDLTPPILLTILLELELAGLITRHPGNKVSAEPGGVNRH